MAPLKVLIVGGGVTGPTLAYWFGRSGADVTLVERSSALRASGQQVDLRAQGIPMMKKMGIESAIRAAVVHEKGMQFINRKGRTKASFPVFESGTGKQGFTSEIEIMRGDLVKVLFDMTEGSPNVKLRFNTTLTDFTQDPEDQADGKVHVTFNDGRTEDFDVVVGADGTGSKTRRLMLGPDAPDPRHPLGGYIGFFSVPSAPGDFEFATFCHLPERRGVARIIGTRKDRTDVTRVYMMTHGHDAALAAAHRSGDREQQKQAWASIFADGPWQCDRFMQQLQTSPEAEDLYATPFEEVRLPAGAWSRGRVVVAGDAAHSQTANGIGCTWGLIGAYILAGEIMTRLATDKTSTTEAVIQGAQRYEEIFRPIATSTHNGNNRLFDALFYPRTTAGIWALHTVAKAVSYVPLDKLPNIDSKTAKWQLPDYPAIEKVKA